MAEIKNVELKRDTSLMDPNFTGKKRKESTATVQVK